MGIDFAPIPIEFAFFLLLYALLRKRLFVEGVCEAIFIHLTRPGDGHRMRGHIFRDRASRGRESIIFNMNRRNKDRPRSNEGVIADIATELIDAIVVRDNGATTDVYFFPEGRIS